MSKHHSPPSKRATLPPWLKVSFKGAKPRREIRRMLRELNLHTVCESALCPNMCECWERQTATFMILGDHCTRDCQFCNVQHGPAPAPDPQEPEHICEAVARLALKFVVITSVTRDDLADYGAGHFAAVVNALRQRFEGIGTEVLTPDFAGSRKHVETVLAAGPSVFNHNLETCARLTPRIRSGADYERSLSVLHHAARSRAGGEGALIKSGFMLGLGETPEEVHEMLHDLRHHGVQIVTIGQYLAPSKDHWPVDRYATPEEFAEWGRIARDRYGFRYAVSAPLVRSSYMAQSAVQEST